MNPSTLHQEFSPVVFNTEEKDWGEILIADEEEWEEVASTIENGTITVDYNH